MTYTAYDTMIITSHRHGHPQMVDDEWRCDGCGHRLAVNGVPPQSSRSRPVWTWIPELRDRRRARMLR